MKLLALFLALLMGVFASTCLQALRAPLVRDDGFAVHRISSVRLRFVEHLRASTPLNLARMYCRGPAVVLRHSWIP